LSFFPRSFKILFLSFFLRATLAFFTCSLHLCHVIGTSQMACASHSAHSSPLLLHLIPFLFIIFLLISSPQNHSLRPFHMNDCSSFILSPSPPPSTTNRPRISHIFFLLFHTTPLLSPPITPKFSTPEPPAKTAADERQAAKRGNATHPPQIFCMRTKNVHRRKLPHAQVR